MNKLVVALLVLNIVLSASAVNVRHQSKATFNVFAQLKDMEGRTFGKNLLDTINLQLQNKSPLGDIAKMLEEIRQDLVIQQKNDDQIHAEREQECATEIEEFNRRINVASIQITDSQAEITNLNSEINRLNIDIKNKETQLEILNTREVELRAAREQDAADFEARQRQSVEVVGALDLIIEKLTTIAPNGDSEAALVELAKIGSSNPILSLVQVAMTFSQEALDNVVNKMEDLRTSLEASIEDDKVNEQAAAGEFQVLLGEIESTRSKIGQALSEAQAQLRQTQAALSIQEQKLTEATEEQQNAFAGKTQKETQCQEWRVKYEADKTARGAEIDVVKQVENILATKIDTMKDYLKGRANGEE